MGVGIYLDTLCIIINSCEQTQVSDIFVEIFL